MVFYSRAEEKCKMLTRMVIVGYCLMAMGLFVLSASYSIFNMWMGNFETSTWLLPYAFTVPFDTSTVYGWYMFWFLQLYAALAYSLSITCATTFFGGCCFYIIAICEHFQFYIKKIDAGVEIMDSKANELGQKNRGKMHSSVLKLKLKMNKMVQTQSKIYE